MKLSPFMVVKGAELNDLTDEPKRGGFGSPILLGGSALSKSGVVLGGGFGCFTWLGIGLLTWAVGMGLLHLFGVDEKSLDGDVGTFLGLALALSTLIASWKINQNLERKWGEEKAEADRRENAERERERELERKYYRENPERLVTEFCPECNMEIPAFARICPYCRSRLRG